MKITLNLMLGTIALVLLAGCGPTVAESVGGMMPGMGPGSGMMARHHAAIPAEYADLTAPEPSAETLAQGESIYTTQCATCHGDGGMGDGPVGKALNPAPAPIAHTSQMLGDNYLYWRVSEGGGMAPFNSAMPSFKHVLSEAERWAVIDTVRMLGSGQMMPRPSMGGQAYSPEFEKEQRTEMLKQAVKQNILTMQQAEVFDQVHDEMDALLADGTFQRGGGMAQMQQQLLNQLVTGGKITQAQADGFNAAHDKLLESGLMQ